MSYAGKWNFRSVQKSHPAQEKKKKKKGALEKDKSWASTIEAMTYLSYIPIYMKWPWKVDLFCSWSKLCWSVHTYLVDRGVCFFIQHDFFSTWKNLRSFKISCSFNIFYCIEYKRCEILLEPCFFLSIGQNGIVYFYVQYIEWKNWN